MSTPNTGENSKGLADIDKEINEVKNRLAARGKTDIELLNKLVEMKAPKSHINALWKKMQGGTEEAEKETGKTEPVELTPQESEIEKDTRTPEKRKVDETRAKYIEEYLKSKKEAKKRVLIARARATTLNIFAGITNTFSKNKIGREIVEEENYFSEEYKEAKKAYDQARVELGNDLWDKEKARLELETPGILVEELLGKLKQYKGKEILQKIIIEERQKIIDAKAKGAPINPALWKELLHGYMSIKPRWKRVALSTALFLIPGIAGAIGAASTTALLSVGSLAAIRFGRSMAMGGITAIAMKGLDKLRQKKERKFNEDIKTDRVNLADRFGRGEVDLEKFEKEAGEIDEEKRKWDRDTRIAKMTMSICLGGLMNAGYQALTEGNHIEHATNTIPTKDIEHQPVKIDTAVVPKPTMQDTTPLKTDTAAINQTPIVKPDTVINKLDTSMLGKPPVIDSTTHNIDTAGIHQQSQIPDSTKISTPPTTGSTQPEIKTPGVPTPVPDSHAPVEITVGKGHGAIQSIHELQNKLKTEYLDVSKAPPSVQHILNTKADKLAIEYGMFKPGQDAESAMVKIGSTFKVDGEGNVTFHQGGGTTDALLEKGVDAKATGVYEGKMVDTDHSGSRGTITTKSSGGTSQFGKDHPQTIPNGARTDEGQIGTKPGISEFERTHPQTIPAGVRTGTDAQTIPKGAGTTPAQTIPAGVRTSAPGQTIPTGATSANAEDFKTNLTAGRNQVISPTRGVFDNSNGINTESISPTRGIYNTGEANTISMGGTETNTPSVEGNGFTREVPMTNVEAQESAYYPGTAPSENIPGTQNPNTVGAESGQALQRFNINEDPRHLHTADEVKKVFGRKNVVIEKPETDNIQGIKYNDWNKATDDMFQKKDIRFNSYDSYEQEDELQRLFGHAEQKVKYVPSDDQNAEVVTVDYFRESPSWNTVNKIPAKYFFNDFNDAKFIDGKAIPEADMNKLVEGGILRDTITPTGSHAYEFTNKSELERLSKTYREIIPKKDLVLGNDKPIGDENIEKYVGRMTKRVYQADDGTFFAPKEKVIINPNSSAASAGYETMRSGGMRTNVYSNSNGTVISPRAGGWQTRSDYSPGVMRLANKATGNIMTHVVRNWTY